MWRPDTLDLSHDITAALDVACLTAYVAYEATGDDAPCFYLSRHDYDRLVQALCAAWNDGNSFDLPIAPPVLHTCLGQVPCLRALVPDSEVFYSKLVCRRSTRLQAPSTLLN